MSTHLIKTLFCGSRLRFVWSSRVTHFCDVFEIFLFLQDGSKNVFIGKVWPGTTAFPDFFNPKANTYWQKQVHGFTKYKDSHFTVPMKKV